MTRNRIISGVVAAVYLIIAYHIGGDTLVWGIAIRLILPLAFIWFGEGGMHVPAWQLAPPDNEVPGCALMFLGWILLLVLPAVFIWLHVSQPT